MDKWTRLLVVVGTWLLIIALVAIMLGLAGRIPHTLLLFSLGALVSYALDPLVEWLRKRPAFIIKGRSHYLSRGGSVAVVFTVFLLAVGIGIGSLYKPLTHQIHLLHDTRQQATYRARATEFLGATQERLAGMGIKVSLTQYAANPASLPPNVKAAANDGERKFFLFLRDVVVSFGEAVIVLLIAAYLLIYSAEMRLKFNAMLPPKLLTHAEVWEEDVNRILGGFVRGQAIIALVLGTSAALCCFAVGIKLWLLVGIFVSVAALIPVFGPYIGAMPAILLALATPTHIQNRVIAAIVILVLFIVINEIGSKILYPRLVGRAIGLHEVLVLFVLFAGLEVGGVPGVLFAAPLTAIAFATVVHLYRFWQDLPDSLLFGGEHALQKTPGLEIAEGGGN